MRTVTEQDPISIEELRHMAAGRFGDLVKAVIDLERRVMIVDADLHAEQEAELLAGGSRQDPKVRERIATLVTQLVQR